MQQKCERDELGMHDPRLAAAPGLVSGILVAALALLGAQPVSGQGYSLIYSFQCGPADGSFPAGVVVDRSGNLYGTTNTGGASDGGIIFRISPDGVETVLHSFVGAPYDGDAPGSGVLRDGAGNLYGTTGAGGTYDGGVVFKLTSGGQMILLHSFSGTPDDGFLAQGGLVRDAAGNFYGATAGGGIYVQGTIYEVAPDRTETVLYNFGSHPQDGNYPANTLLLDPLGNLYGTSWQGGSKGEGTAFELSASGQESVLHSFMGGQHDGARPAADLLRDTAGNLYGTTIYGGNQTCVVSRAKGCGAIFKLNPNGTERLLYKFQGVPDGANPNGGMVRDTEGNLFGTTYYGGSGSCYDGFSYGCGTIYELSRTGQESVLYSFTGLPDGAGPVASLVRDSAGNLYGVTFDGGAYGCGTVFKFTP